MQAVYLTLVALLGAQSTSARALSERVAQDSESPCGRINTKIVEAREQNGTARITGQEAYDCLQSIPFDSARAVEFVQEARKHVQFQSDIELLKNPPSATFDTVDLLQGLSDIEQKAERNLYSSQVDFDTSLRDLLNSAHDGHLGISGLCSDSIFSFSFDLPLVSLSNSSTSAPEVYELGALGSLDDSDWDGVPIDTINGQAAADFLVDYSSPVSLADADARYNSLFATPLRHGAGTNQFGLFSSRNNLWTGNPTVNYTYTNGTEGIWITHVLVNQRTWNYTSGQDLFDFFCAPPTETSSSSNATASSNSTSTESEAPSAPSQTSGPNFFPEPVVRDPYNLLSGYYLNGSYEDTAVLVVPTFETSGSDDYTELALPQNETAEFASAASNFISQAKSDNKTRLIIDLSANGGGTTLAGFNLFKLFFPQTQIYSANRFRNHEFSRLFMKALDTYTEDYTDEQTYYLTRHFAWAGQVSPTQTALNWTSYLNFTGPDSSELTALTAFQNFTANSNDDTPIQGYNRSTVFDDPPFAAEDILLITDGFCASTCSIFVDLMTKVAGVSHTLAFGGLPPSSSSSDLPQPMQLVGGTRGTEQYSWTTLANAAHDTLTYIEERLNASAPTLTHDEIASTLTHDEIRRYKALMPKAPADFPLQFRDGSVNLRNGYDRDDDHLPIQYRGQEAKCRLYYTRENILAPATSWTAAADATWGGKPCAAVGKDDGDGSSAAGGGGGAGGGQTQAEESSSGAPTIRLLSSSGMLAAAVLGVAAVGLVF